MQQIQCFECKKMIKTKKIVKGTKVHCECGCTLVCLDKDEYMSRWKVIK